MWAAAFEMQFLKHTFMGSQTGRHAGMQAGKHWTRARASPMFVCLNKVLCVEFNCMFVCFTD